MRIQNITSGDRSEYCRYIYLQELLLWLQPRGAAHTDSRLAAQLVDRRVTRLQTLTTVVESAAGHKVAQLEARTSHPRAQRGSGEAKAGCGLLVMVLEARGVGTRPDMRPNWKLSVEFRQRLCCRNLNIHYFSIFLVHRTKMITDQCFGSQSRIDPQSK